MNPQYIGHHKMRIKIIGKHTLDVLAEIEGIEIIGNNVYYPANMAKQVEEVVAKNKRVKIKERESK